MQNKDSASELITGGAGEHVFCRECERNKICQDKPILPKILRCCSDAISFYSANVNYQNYPWRGSYLDQPKWIMEMNNIIGTEKAKVEAWQREHHGN